MRNIETKDIFSFCRCLKNIGIKDEMKKIAEKADTISDMYELGIDFFMNIIDLAIEKKSEKPIYDFLADIFEIKAEEVEHMRFNEFIDQLKELNSNNNLVDFFKSAVKLMK